MKDRGKLIILTAGGFFAGVLNGLLGAGGGILLVFLMSAVLCAKNGDNGYSKRDIMAISISVMLPISVFSAIRYGLSGNLNFEYTKKLVLPALLGGSIGGVLLNKLKESVVMKIFAVLVIYSGASMLLR